MQIVVERAGRMWPNHTAPTGRCSRNVRPPSNQKKMRGGVQEASVPPSNEAPTQRDVAPERPYKQERFTLPASVAAAAADERGPHPEQRVVRAVRAEMLCLSGLSVALALALLPGSGAALKEAECEGKLGG